jgi:serine/threonine protein kinase
MNQTFAVKLFPIECDKSLNLFFLNEARFQNISHPNIAAPLFADPRLFVNLNGEISAFSAIITRYIPHEDLYAAFTKYNVFFDDRLIRTYFYQIISALEYLHNKGIAHLDLKLENLMLGDHFQVKIVDFDLASKEGDHKVTTKGTKYYRAPEIIKQECKDPKKADIYSAGIILFVLKCQGILPHAEKELYLGFDYFECLSKNPEEFWKHHAEMQGADNGSFCEDFRELFEKMTKEEPSERPSLKEIKESKWMRGERMGQEEVVKTMRKYYARTYYLNE